MNPSNPRVKRSPDPEMVTLRKDDWERFKERMAEKISRAQMAYALAWCVANSREDIARILDAAGETHAASLVRALDDEAMCAAASPGGSRP